MPGSFWRFQLATVRQPTHVGWHLVLHQNSSVTSEPAVQQAGRWTCVQVPLWCHGSFINQTLSAPNIQFDSIWFMRTFTQWILRLLVRSYQGYWIRQLWCPTLILWCQGLWLAFWLWTSCSPQPIAGKPKYGTHESRATAAGIHNAKSFLTELDPNVTLEPNLGDEPIVLADAVLRVWC